MVHKMLMTGALVVIAPGTSAQPLVAMLFQLFFLLLVLKLAPYASDSDDYSSFIAALTLALTMLCGFALMSDEGKEDKDFGDTNLVGILLVVISTLCMVLNFAIFMREVDFSQYRRLSCAKQALAKKETATRVSPASAHVDHKQESAEKMAELRDARIQYGADSDNFRAVAKKHGLFD